MLTVERPSPPLCVGSMRRQDGMRCQDCDGAARRPYEGLKARRRRARRTEGEEECHGEGRPYHLSQLYIYANLLIMFPAPVDAERSLRKVDLHLRKPRAAKGGSGDLLSC